jgi:hypothetical protein
MATFCEQEVAKERYSFRPLPFQHLRPGVKEVFAPLFAKSGLFPLGAAAKVAAPAFHG